MKVDWLIAGAGLTGCVLAERIATELGQKVLIVERRDHIGGNTYDYTNEHGIVVQKYGPHVFHTNSVKVWNYLSQFTEWRPYEHKVLASIDGKLVPVPFNLNSLHALFPSSYATKIETMLMEQYGYGVNVPILRMRDGANGELRGFADYVYEKVFRGYTTKQWELTPEELDPSVTARVPVSISRDDRYFQDKFQAMPTQGFTAMVSRILAHPNIKVLLKTDYREVAGEIRYQRMIYTGAMDEFFDYAHGLLPYRSLRFEFQTLNERHHQPAATVNYPNGHPWTRITELKYLSAQDLAATTLAVEYPQRHIPGVNEPYYPIPKPDCRAQYDRYLQTARELNGSVVFAGRLADYRYYNMDQAVARALAVFEALAGTDQAASQQAAMIA